MASARDRTKVDRRTNPGLVVDGRAEAITDLMLEVAQCFFRIRALGQKIGLITSWGGGAFGFIRSLALLGPLTVPQIAEMRPTSPTSSFLKTKLLRIKGIGCGLVTIWRLGPGALWGDDVRG